MGSSSSKFKKYLLHGDEYAAMQVYQSSNELRRALDPNHSYGDQHFHNTPLHYAARHGMKHLIRAFLNEMGGNPNRRNARGQTSLHCVCSVSQQKSLSALERRLYSVILLLSWRGPCLPSGQRERIDVNARDDSGSSALHYAAQSGLKRCVEYLLAHGADPYVENKSGLTPFDMARCKNHHEVALLLESRMVASATPEEPVPGIRRVSTYDSVLEGGYSGLRAQDLQEAKEQVIAETADVLHIPHYAAEALLKSTDWSCEVLLDRWKQDPVLACQDAGIQMPITVPSPCGVSAQTLPTTPKQKMLYSENSFLVDEQLGEDELLCEVCCDLIEGVNSCTLSCRHNFCSRCWKNYLYIQGPIQYKTFFCCD